jgi:2-polyprenyl-3-methyl-5-hydroxy-6-metoxy-1,4-benzoquinol methylase
MSKDGPIVEGGIIAGNLYDKYGTNNPVARLLMSGFYRAIDALVRETEASNIHEVGCGEGRLSAFLAKGGRSVRASDFSTKVIAEARAIAEREKVGVTFKVASIYDLTVHDDSAPLIVCCEVLEHLPDPHKALEVLTGLARPHLLVSVPREPIWRVLNIARGRYLSAWGDTPGHVQHWSRTSFLRLLRGYADIVRVLSPLPWTVVLARVRQDG